MIMCLNRYEARIDLYCVEGISIVRAIVISFHVKFYQSFVILRNYAVYLVSN